MDSKGKASSKSRQVTLAGAITKFSKVPKNQKWQVNLLEPEFRQKRIRIRDSTVILNIKLYLWFPSVSYKNISLYR